MKACKRLFPKQTRGDQNCRCVVTFRWTWSSFGRDVAENAVPLTDLAETVFSREERQARTGAAAAVCCEGCLADGFSVTIAQWCVTAASLDAAATKPRGRCPVQQKEFRLSCYQRVETTLSTGRSASATRGRHMRFAKFSSLMKPSRNREAAGRQRRDEPEPTLLGLVGAACCPCLRPWGRENQEWFLNDRPQKTATSTRKLPFRLVSIVPG